MNLFKLDLNLLIYFDALIQEKNVTKAAQHLGVSQPAVSSGLKRLRLLFNDPILVRTTHGMAATERALKLQPKIKQVLKSIELFMQPMEAFEAETSTRVFRIMASDYAEATLIPEVLKVLSTVAPKVCIDLMSPGDIKLSDLEQGNVDLAINRFETLPKSLHSQKLWLDSFSCIINKNHPFAQQLTLDNYLNSQHVWVSKTGLGIGAETITTELQKLGWVDIALKKLGLVRNIKVFTRHFLSAIHLCQQQSVIATVPTKVAMVGKRLENLLVVDPPFNIEAIPLHLVWSPLIENNPGHLWLRKIIMDVATHIQAELTSNQ